MDYFKLKIGQFLETIEDREKEIDVEIQVSFQFLKMYEEKFYLNFQKSLKRLKKFSKIANDKKNESLIEEIINLDISQLSRKELKKLNASRDKSDQIRIPTIDVGEIIKHRRTLNRSRNTTFIKNESIKADATFTKKESLACNATYTVDRDYVTPDNDSPMMEFKRKLIEEELNRSVTRRPQRKFPNGEGTPVVAETSIKTSITCSPATNTPRPRKLADMRKDENLEESESTIELQSVAPIRYTFDDIHTDDEISEDEHLDIYPAWTKYMKLFDGVQKMANPDLIDTLFSQDLNIEPREIFPNTSPTRLERRRSSMWKQ